MWICHFHFCFHILIFSQHQTHRGCVFHLFICSRMKEWEFHFGSHGVMNSHRCYEDKVLLSNTCIHCVCTCSVFERCFLVIRERNASVCHLKLLIICPQRLFRNKLHWRISRFNYSLPFRSGLSLAVLLDFILPNNDNSSDFLSHSHIFITIDREAKVQKVFLSLWLVGSECNMTGIATFRLIPTTLPRVRAEKAQV